MSKIYPSIILVCYIYFSKIKAVWMLRQEMAICCAVFVFKQQQNFSVNCIPSRHCSNYQSSSKPFFPVAFLSSEFLKHSVVLLSTYFAIGYYLLSLPKWIDFLRPGTILLILPAFGSAQNPGLHLDCWTELKQMKKCKAIYPDYQRELCVANSKIGR